MAWRSREVAFWEVAALLLPGTEQSVQMLGEQRELPAMVRAGRYFHRAEESEAVCI